MDGLRERAERTSTKCSNNCHQRAMRCFAVVLPSNVIVMRCTTGNSSDGQAPPVVIRPDNRQRLDGLGVYENERVVWLHTISVGD